MKIPILILMTSGLVFAQTAPPTTKTAKIEEIFRLTKVDQMQKQVMAQMGAMMKQQAGVPSEQSQKILDLVAEKMSWDSLKPDFIKLYEDTYTEDEISGILLFYESPPGQAMLAKSPALMTNTMALMQKRMAQIKPEMDKMMKDMTAK
jgi:hypothetical protein